MKRLSSRAWLRVSIGLAALLAIGVGVGLVATRSHSTPTSERIASTVPSAAPSTSAPPAPLLTGQPLGTPVPVTDSTGQKVGSVTAYQEVVHAAQGPLRASGGPISGTGPLAVTASPPSAGEYLQIVVNAVGAGLGLDPHDFTFAPGGGQDALPPDQPGTSGWDDDAFGGPTDALAPRWAVETFDVPAGTSGVLSYAANASNQSGQGTWQIPASPTLQLKSACVTNLTDGLVSLQSRQLSFPASVPLATALEAGVLYPPIVSQVQRAATDASYTITATNPFPSGVPTKAEIAAAAQSAPVTSAISAACQREQDGTQPVAAAASTPSGGPTATAAPATPTDHAPTTADGLTSGQGEIQARSHGQVVVTLRLAPVTQRSGSDVIDVTIHNASAGPYTFTPANTYINGGDGGQYAPTQSPAPVTVAPSATQEVSLLYSGEPAQGAWTFGLDSGFNVSADVCFTVGQPFPATNSC